jgi:hypothetical protein
MSLFRRNAEGLATYRDILTVLDDVGRPLILENAVQPIAVVESPNRFLASVNGVLIEELSFAHFPLSPQQVNNIRVFPQGLATLFLRTDQIHRSWIYREKSARQLVERISQVTLKASWLASCSKMDLCF